MNRIITLFVLIIFQTSVFAQLEEKDLKMSPPGTVWVKDKIYIDQYPVTNADYSEFLFNVADYYNPKVHDTIQKLPLYKVNWDKLYKHLMLQEPNEKYVKKIEQNYYSPLAWATDSNEMFLYYDSDIYKSYPLINVSYEQASEYCKWRTDMVMLSYAMNSKNMKQRDVFYKKIKFRLPSQEEWELAYNTYETNKEPFTKSVLGEDNEFDIFRYVPGNVSEMLMEKGKAIGLSWRDAVDKNSLLKINNYDKPSDWLGFRCVCEILEY